MRKKLTPKKLLVASVGVATLSLVIGCDRRPTGNLAMPDPKPQPSADGGGSTTEDAGADKK